MKLVAQSTDCWQFHLSHQEANVLLHLVNHFPFAEMMCPPISKSDQSPQSSERSKLLHESMTEHRRHLHALAAKLLGEDKWKNMEKFEKGRLLALDSSSREILLQILNDIRLGCWHALGEPEAQDTTPHHNSPQTSNHWNLMNLAGYFEHALIEPEE